MQLVDLAGSERQAYTQGNGQVAEQQMLKEAIEINKSLFTLRQVITALTENAAMSANQTRTNGGFNT